MGHLCQTRNATWSSSWSSTDTYHRIAELWFDSAEDLQASGSGEGQATTADIPTFATGGATMLIVDVD